MPGATKVQQPVGLEGLPAKPERRAVAGDRDEIGSDAREVRGSMVGHQEMAARMVRKLTTEQMKDEAPALIAQKA